MAELLLDPLEAVRKRGDILGRLSENDRHHLLREAAASPATAALFARLLKTPDPIQAIHESAMMAAINEMDPSRHSHSRGLWPVLREEIRRLPSAIDSIVDEVVGNMTTGEAIAVMKAMQSGGSAHLGLGAVGVSGMGILDIFGEILGSAIEVGGGVLQTKISGKIQEDIAKDQMRLTERLETQRLQAEQDLAEKQLAAQTALKAKEIEEIARTQVKIVEKETEAGQVAGIPAWVIPVGLVGLGLVLFLAIRMGGK